MSTPRLAPLLLFAAALLATACDSPSGESGPDWPPRGDAVTGDLQQDTVGDQLPQAITIRVVDEDGDPIAGQAVTFTVTQGGGSLFAATSQTSADGVASNRWTLGLMAGDTQRVEARMVDPESGQAVVLATFRAVGVPDAPAAIAALPPESRTGGAGEALADSLQARVTDAHGNPVPGAAVTWSASGGGAISPATGTTNAQGVARASWTLGTTFGVTQRAFAAISPAARAEFTAVAGIPAGAVLVKAGGDEQTTVGGTTLAQELRVELRTAGGMPIWNAPVTWTPSVGHVAPTTSLTNAAGQTATTWSLPTQPGEHQLTASVPGGASVVFTATAEAGPPTTITPLVPPNRSGGAGQTLADSLVVRVTDARGNVAAGVPVTWTVLTGDGSVSPVTAVTGANGVAKAAWTLGLRVGLREEVQASISSGASVRFGATALVPAGAMFVKISGDNETRPVGGSIVAVVEVRTADGRPLERVGVHFTSSDPGYGYVSPGGTSTDGNGRASTRWWLGWPPGQKVLRVTSTGVPTVEFTATATSP